MRYVLYLFTLILVFVGGMLVSNLYLPTRNSSVAASISVPDPADTIPQLKDISLDTASRNLTVLGEALNSCPVVVTEEKDRLLAEINLLLARQDFDIKKALFELEIAKNTPGSSVTAQFAQASADYAAAQQRLEALALQLYPPQPKETDTQETAPLEAADQQTPDQNAQTPAEAPAKTTKQAPAKEQPKTTDKQDAATDQTRPQAAKQPAK